MSDILNQDEINALIEAFKATGGQETSAKTPEKQVRLYDFTRPDKFAKEHLRALNMIHGKHGAAFASGLTSLLRFETRVELLALDQLAYKEYCASVPDGTLFIEAELDSLAPTAIFEFNPLFVSLCVDSLAGGSSHTAPSTARITEIDRAIFRPVVDLALRMYTDAWSSYLDLKPKISRMSTETTARQVFLPAEAVLVCGYEISVGDKVSMMSICIPASAIEPVLPALTVGRAIGNQMRSIDKVDKNLMRSFEGVELGCKAVLGRTLLPLGEIADLEVGDVIKLPTKRDGNAELWVGNVATYGGTLGLSGKNLAIKINAPIDENTLDDGGFS